MMKKLITKTLGMVSLIVLTQACGDKVAEPQDKNVAEVQAPAGSDLKQTDEVSIDVIKHAPLEVEQTDIAKIEEQAGKMPAAVIARIKVDAQGQIAQDATEELRYVYDVSNLEESQLPTVFSAATSDPFEKVEKEKVAETAFLNTYNYAPSFGQYGRGYSYGGAISPYMGNSILPQFGMNQFGGMFDFDDYYDNFGYNNLGWNNYSYMNQQSYWSPWSNWNGGLQYGNFNQWQNAVSYIPSPTLGNDMYGNSYLNNSLVYPYSYANSYNYNGYMYSSRLPMWY